MKANIMNRTRPFRKGSSCSPECVARLDAQATNMNDDYYDEFNWHRYLFATDQLYGFLRKAPGVAAPNRYCRALSYQVQFQWETDGAFLRRYCLAADLPIRGSAHALPRTCGRRRGEAEVG